MNLDPLLRQLPPGFEIVLADVGSAGGLKDRWAPVRSITSAMLFEPREGAAEPQRIGRDTLYPVALGKVAGQETLNITALPNMSSTLAPNAELLGGFRKKGTHTQITSTLEMTVDSLDAIATREGRVIDAIKVDTQGSELGILEGAAGTIANSVLFAEIEVSFLERYRGQALAGDIIAFMAGHGFDLIDLYRLKRYRALNSANVGNVSLGGGQRAGRLAYGDAFFLRREEDLLARVAQGGETVALKAILGLLIYGKADMAARLLDLSGSAIPEARRDGMQRFLRKAGKRWLRTGGVHHALDYLARRA
ncbi:hypothetical protein ACFB49_05380 [Sphingomonas sp. DBB INV C78]|uniref:FkbM family methyltransferase n=1 Tax=Sphingomonas sp. DBB INV C78 TaxID=3349434 RepID=UPI0036D32C35